jgi:dimeric dUTPase (all-alpha-NTP-PPase superfamily)
VDGHKDLGARLEGDEIMDKLEKLFTLQRRLEEAIGAKIFDTDHLHPNQLFILLNFVGVITEACEALENTPWKPWKKSMVYKQKEFRKELIDLLHFVFNLCIAADMSPEDIYDMYAEKHKENMRRQKEGY